MNVSVAPGIVVEAQSLQRSQFWLALTLLLALATAGVLLPAWCWMVVLVLVFLRLASWRRQWRPLPRTPRWALTAALLAAWGWGFRGQWLNGPSVIAFFAFVLVLKWHEVAPARLRRDTLVLVVGACVLGALGAVHHLALVSLPVLLALALAVVGTLAALHGVSHPLRQAASVLGWSLPLAAVMFVLMPRVQGPLWDFGLALGLPIGVTAPRGGPGLGGQANLAPGVARSSALEDGTVLVANFEGYRPPAAQLYWRGPVLTGFDGEQWTPSAWWATRSERMAAGYRRAAAWRQRIEGRGEPLRYHMRVAGHGNDWLYALDLPATLPPESYLTRDWQLLSMTPLREESSYQTMAWMDWRDLDPQLNEADRAEALALPSAESVNPRLRAMGQALQRREVSDTGRLAEALAHFAQGGYRLDPRERGLSGPVAYDHFLYESKAGGADQFAGAFVLLMRAAGVPARLVTGYRGGRLMGATDYVLVKQSNAHAWAEVWLKDRGWTRADPADAAQPMREPRQKAAATLTDQPTAATAPEQSASEAQRTREDDAGWSWLNGLDGWVLHYDADRRTQLLDGLSESRQGPVWVLMLALAALAPLLSLWWLWRHWRGHAATWGEAWVLLARRLATVDFGVSPGECPTHVERRLTESAEAWAPPAAELVASWTRSMYGPGAAHTSLPDFLRQVQRFRPRAFRSAK